MAEEKKEPTAPGDVIGGKKVKEAIPLKGMRRIMAEHMMQSLQQSAQMTQMCLVEMTEMKKFRQELLAEEETTGIHYTYADLFVKVVAEALKQYPSFNASLIGDEIILWEDVNVGLALAYELREGGHGLIVPVIRDAGNKSLAEIHSAVQDLVERGRNNRLRPDDVTGGTFTLSNIGPFGTMDVGFATVILNQPETGLLVTGPIIDEPVVRDGQIVIRPIMKYSLSLDHRVLSAQATIEFLAIVNGLIENPRQLLS